MKAVICPVCGGTGHVDLGFYNQTSGQWTSAGGLEPCRSCGGQGYVIIPDYDVHSIFPSEEDNEDIREIIKGCS